MSDGPTTVVSRRELRVALAGVGAWLLLYGWRACAGHYSLRTNAYDLSVFDYALWNTLHAKVGFVPFYDYSIFSDHFMPILFGLLPVYALHPSAITLVLLQIVALAAAGVVGYVTVRALGAPPVAAAVLIGVFLLSRRSHSAAVSYFYPESFQPLFTFAMILGWLRGRWVLFWISVVLLLATKEDAALYVAAFAVVQFAIASATRPQAVKAFALAAVWLLMAVFVAVPMSRHADGLTAAFPFWETRLGAVNGTFNAAELAGRLTSWKSLGESLDLVLGFGLLPLAAPLWLLVIVPGALIDLATIPGSGQATFAAHYAFPLLPWLVVASAAGWQRLAQRWPRVAFGWVCLLALGTLLDAPVVRNVLNTRFDPVARAVRTSLSAADDPRLAVLPNLAPHVTHSNDLFVFFEGRTDPPPSHRVLLTRVGDPWPFTPEQVDELIRRYQADARYRQVSDGPLFVFSPVAEPGR